jgi:hypothetical protein
MPDRTDGEFASKPVTPGYGDELVEYLKTQADPNVDVNEMDIVIKNIPRRGGHQNQEQTAKQPESETNE